MQPIEEKIFGEIQIDDLEGDIREIAEVAGIEVARLLIQHFPSSCLYIPRVVSIRPFFQRMVRKLRQEGKTTKQIARILNVCEDTVKKYITRQAAF